MLSTQQSPELPDFEGDDLKGLACEINKLALFRKQAQSFRWVYGQLCMENDSVWSTMCRE